MAFYDALTKPAAIKDFYTNDVLVDMTRELTETLRKWESIPVDEDLCAQQWQQVSADYEVVVGAIRLLQE